MCLNNKYYYNNVQVRILEHDKQLLFGKSFACSIKKGKIYFNLKGNLSERIKDLEILLSIITEEDLKKMEQKKNYYA